MSIQNLPFRVSRGRLIAAMAASALDPHLLVGLDAKSTPRARSFRERAEVCLLCVSDACLLDAPACLLSPRHTTKWITFGSSARRRIAETQRPGCSTATRPGLGLRGWVHGHYARIDLRRARHCSHEALLAVRRGGPRRHCPRRRRPLGGAPLVSPKCPPQVCVSQNALRKSACCAVPSELKKPTY